MIIYNPSGGAQSSTSGFSLGFSNQLRGVTPLVTDAGTQNPDNITNPDHGLTYTSGDGVEDFTISFGVQSNVSYVGISGHTAATLADATIQLFNDQVLVATAILKRNNNVMFSFSPIQFTDMRLVFNTAPSSYKTTVSYIAAGERILFTTGEQAGYKRNWLNRSLTQNVTVNLQSAPIAISLKQGKLKGVLNLPNIATSVSRGAWQDFLDFAYTEPFFMNEVTTVAESSYIGFNPKEQATAHQSTRALDALSLGFDCFNGL